MGYDRDERTSGTTMSTSVHDDILGTLPKAVCQA